MNKMFDFVKEKCLSSANHTNGMKYNYKTARTFINQQKRIFQFNEIAKIHFLLTQ